MAERVMRPKLALGVGWADPSNALVEDGSAAVWPASSSPPAWLRLTDLDDRSLPLYDEVVGVTVVLKGIPVTTLGWAALFDGASLVGWGDHNTPAPQVWDGNDATFVENPGGTGASLSVAHDLGEAMTVGWIKARVRASMSVTPLVHYSNDGVAWNAVGWSPDAPSELVADEIADFDLSITPVSARYWRMSLANTSVPRAYRFELFGPGDPPPA